MSLDCVSLDQDQHHHAYHVLSVWEQEVINDFVKDTSGPAGQGVTPDMTRQEARAAANQIRALISTPNADRRLLEQRDLRHQDPFKGKSEPQLSPDQFLAKAKGIINEWADYLEASGGYYAGRGPGP